MPSLRYTTPSIKAVADCTALSLSADHYIVVYSPSDTVYRSKFPDNVDIRVAGPISIFISGLLNKKMVPKETIARSELSNHILEYFKTNAAGLGLGAVSELESGEDDRVQITLSPAPDRPETALPVRVYLTAVHMECVWTTPSGPSEDQLVNSPFSKRMSLPFRTLLDNVISRFVTHQLVKRYPLIFGSWRQQLEVETPFLTKIFKCINIVIERSPNPEFKSRCAKLLKNIRRERRNVLYAESQYLTDYLGSLNESIEDEDTSLTAEQAFCLSMEVVYRNGMRKPQFKGITYIPRDTTKEDDDDLAQAFSSSQPPLPSSESQPQDDETELGLADTPPTSPGPLSASLALDLEYFDRILQQHTLTALNPLLPDNSSSADESSFSLELMMSDGVNDRMPSPSSPNLAFPKFPPFPYNEDIGIPDLDMESQDHFDDIEVEIEALGSDQEDVLLFGQVNDDNRAIDLDLDSDDCLLYLVPQTSFVPLIALDEEEDGRMEDGYRDDDSESMASSDPWPVQDLVDDLDPGRAPSLDRVSDAENVSDMELLCTGSDAAFWSQETGFAAGIIGEDSDMELDSKSIEFGV